MTSQPLKELRSLRWNQIGKLLSISSLVPFLIGFFKMFIYINGEYSWETSLNAYVGGDAYNYIINANYATAYFVLGGIMLLSAFGCGILWYLEQIAAAAGQPAPVGTIHMSEVSPPSIAPDASAQADVRVSEQSQTSPEEATPNA